MAYATNEIHAVTLGESINSSTHEQHYTFRYSPRAPLPAASDTLPYIQDHETNSNALQVSFPAAGGTAVSYTAVESTSAAKASEEKEIDCVLIWDPISKGYRLERIDSIIKFQADAVPRAPPAPPVTLSLPTSSSSTLKLNHSALNGNVGSKNGQAPAGISHLLTAESSDEEIRVSSVPPKHLRKPSKARALLNASIPSNPSPVGSPLAMNFTENGHAGESEEDSEEFEEVMPEKEDMGDISMGVGIDYRERELPVPSTSTYQAVPIRIPPKPSLPSKPPPAIEIVTKNNKRKSSAPPTIKPPKSPAVKIPKVATKSPIPKIIPPKAAASKRPPLPKINKVATGKSPKKSTPITAPTVPKKRARKDSLPTNSNSNSTPIIPSVSKKTPAPSRSQQHTAHPPPSSGEETDDSSNNEEDSEEENSENDNSGLPEGYLVIPTINSGQPGFGRRNSGEASESEEEEDDFDDLASSINFGMVENHSGMGSGGKGMGSGGKGMGSGGKGMGSGGKVQGRRKSSSTSVPSRGSYDGGKNGDSSRDRGAMSLERMMGPEGKRAREEDIPDSSEED